jgi:hypothetical protein
MGAVALRAPPGLPSSGASGLWCGFHAHGPNATERRVKAAWRQKRPEGSGGGRPHPRLFCWKAYTLALTQSGCALHWHASKTAPQDAELGGLPGDFARVDGAAGRGRRDESAARGISRLGERLREEGLWGAGVGGRGGAGPSRTLDPTGVKTNRGIHARPLLNDAMLRAAQPLPDQSSVIYLKKS